jgi:hypothetical protein
MNYKIAAATLVLACAVGTAGCSNNGNGQQGDVPAGATTGQPGAPYAGASAGAAATAGMPGMGTIAGGMGAPGNAAGPSTFEDLAGSKGYITQEDARRDEWLSGHFSSCDSDNDGKLTQQEYTQCTQQAGSGAMEGVPPASSVQ